MRIKQYSLEVDPDGRSLLIENWSKNYALISDVSTAEKVAIVMNDVFRLGFQAEEFAYLLVTNSKFKPIAIFLIAKGSVDMAYVSVRDIFVRALLCGGKGFIFTHNHPSGDSTPSTQDYGLTKRIYEGAKLLDLLFLDHVILAYDTYYSFSNNHIIINEKGDSDNVDS